MNGTNNSNVAKINLDQVGCSNADNTLNDPGSGSIDWFKQKYPSMLSRLLDEHFNCDAVSFFYYHLLDRDLEKSKMPLSDWKEVAHTMFDDIDIMLYRVKSASLDKNIQLRSAWLDKVRVCADKVKPHICEGHTFAAPTYYTLEWIINTVSENIKTLTDPSSCLALNKVTRASVAIGERIYEEILGMSDYVENYEDRS